MSNGPVELKQFEQAVRTAQHGDMVNGYRLMRRVLLADPHYAPAWFWMSRLVDDSSAQARVPGARPGARPWPQAGARCTRQPARRRVPARPVAARARAAEARRLSDQTWPDQPAAAARWR